MTKKEVYKATPRNDDRMRLSSQPDCFFFFISCLRRGEYKTPQTGNWMGSMRKIGWAVCRKLNGQYAGNRMGSMREIEKSIIANDATMLFLTFNRTGQKCFPEAHIRIIPP
jgi:hypothetical protein